MAVAKIPEGRILIDEVTLRSFHPKAARLNLDGVELEGPRMVIQFEVEVDRVLGEMNRLTRIFRKRNAVTLSLDFVEQMELPKLVPHDDRPRLTDPLGSMPTAAKNGADTAKASELVTSASAKKERAKART